ADLGLDAGSHETRERCTRVVIVRANQRAVVDRAPDRLMHAVALPDRAIGEADLAPYRPPPASEAMLVQGARSLIARFGRQARIALAERRHLARALIQRDQLAGQHREDCSGWLRNARPRCSNRKATRPRPSTAR